MSSAAHHDRAVTRARRHASRPHRAAVPLPGRAGGRPAGALAFAVVTVLAGLGWLLWPTPAAGHTPALATVIEPADCGGDAAGRDVVRFDFGGRSVRAELDGCGNRAGAQITVEVPGTAVHDGMTVRLAGTGVPDSALTARRLAAVLVVLAAALGALLAWRLVPHGDMQGQSRPR